MQRSGTHYGRLAAAVLTILIVTLALQAPPAAAQSGVYTPKPGSPERKVLMNTLRVPVEKDLGMRVIFVITRPTESLRVLHDWAFINAEFRHENGDPMGEAYYDATDDSDLVVALLHRVHGRWHVVTHDTGTVDVGWPGWSKQYHAPAALFPRFDLAKP